MPDCGPFGETSREARLRVMAAAFFVKRPFGGCVESVFAVLAHFFLALRGMRPPEMKLIFFRPKSRHAFV
jgi:hypothetical protein